MLRLVGRRPLAVGKMMAVADKMTAAGFGRTQSHHEAGTAEVPDCHRLWCSTRPNWKSRLVTFQLNLFNGFHYITLTYIDGDGYGQQTKENKNFGVHN